MLGIALGIHACIVADTLVVGARALALLATLSFGAGVIAGAAVCWIFLEVGAAIAAAVGFVVATCETLTTFASAADGTCGIALAAVFGIVGKVDDPKHCGMECEFQREL